MVDAKKVKVDKKGNLVLPKKDAIEMAENLAEELFKSPELLDGGLPQIPEQVKKLMAKIDPEKMADADKRYEERLKKQEEVEKKYCEVMKRRNYAVHLPTSEYEAIKESLGDKLDRQEKHLRFTKEGLMSAIYSIVSAWMEDIKNHEDVYSVHERHFGDREEKIKNCEKLTDDERFGTLKYTVEKDGTKTPVMVDAVLTDVSQLKSPVYYTLYMSEILERLIRENVVDYTDSLNATGITKEYEKEARELSDELAKLQ